MAPAARTKLVLVRHGQTDWNAGGRFQGHRDIGLNRIGRAQADAVAGRLVPLKATQLVTSDLGRAVETATAIGAASGLEPTLDERLREVHVGSWEGRTLQEIIAEDPAVGRAVASGADFRRSPEGETAEEAGVRIAGVLAELADAHPGRTTIVVSHGLALRVGLALFTGLGLPGAAALSGLWNCSWSILELHDRWRIQTYNSVVTASD